MGILARLRLAKIRNMVRPNSPDMPPKRTKKVRLGIRITRFLEKLQYQILISPVLNSDHTERNILIFKKN